MMTEFQEGMAYAFIDQHSGPGVNPQLWGIHKSKARLPDSFGSGDRAIAGQIFCKVPRYVYE